MELIEGDTLESVWDSFSPSQKGETIKQLQGYFSRLRGIKAHSATLANEVLAIN